MTEKTEHEPRRFYDVERFRRVYLETLGKRRGVWKVLGRITHAFDSVQGFLVVLLAPVIVFGTLAGVILGSLFGPLVFIAIFGGIIGGLALFAEKRVGQSMQFGDYNLWKRMMAQTLAFVLVMGLIFFLVFLARNRPF